jgi:hypothetical protein
VFFLRPQLVVFFPLRRSRTAPLPLIDYRRSFSLDRRPPPSHLSASRCSNIFSFKTKLLSQKRMAILYLFYGDLSDLAAPRSHYPRILRRHFTTTTDTVHAEAPHLDPPIKSIGSVAGSREEDVTWPIPYLTTTRIVTPPMPFSGVDSFPRNVFIEANLRTFASRIN